VCLLASARQPASVSASQTKDVHLTVSEAALLADLLTAPDDAARRVLLDGHAADVTDALRNALRETADRRVDDLDAGLVACQAERLVAERLHDQPAIVGADWRFARIASQRGDYDRALSAMLDAQQVAHTIHDEQLEHQTLANLAIVYRLRGDLEQALALQQQLLPIFEAAHDAHAVARTLNNIGIIQEQRGEYRDALAAAQRALRLNEPGTVVYASSLHTIANIYQSQNEWELAIDYDERALAQRDQTTSTKLTILLSLGEEHRVLKHLDRAAAYLAQAHAIAESSGAQPRLAFALRIEALVQADRGDKAGAVPLLERSLAIGRAIKDPDIISYTLTNLAALRRDLGEPAVALALAQEASALGGSQPSRGLAQAHYQAGESLAALGQPAEARRELEASIAMIEELRNRIVGGDVEREQFLEANVVPYQAMMALLLDEGANEAALQYAERTRARALMDDVRRGHVSFERWLTPEERAEGRTLEHNLQTAQRRMARAAVSASAPTSALADAGVDAGAGAAPAQQQIEAARRELTAWRVRVSAAHPELRLASGAAEIPTLMALAPLVRDPATALLAYASVDARTWLFVITRSGDAAGPPVLTVHRLALDQETLTSRVHRLRTALAQRSLEFAADARELAVDLLEPAAADLAGKTRLVILPDGILWDVPFQALQLTPGRFLIEQAIVEYAPSLTFLTEAARRSALSPSESASQSRSRSQLHAQPRRARGDVLALGNPAFDRASDAGPALPPLPGTEREARTIAALYDPGRTRLLVGTAATEARVKRDAARYRVLHLATHGVLDDADPMYSALMLARPQARDAGASEPRVTDDGRLEARELMDLRLDADLVVLSACETARGRIGAGEGLLGLSWALLVAGARDVVVSQWQVDATSTSQLMVDLHRELTRAARAARVTRSAPAPPDVGAALQHAVRRLMRTPRYRHPFYWAAFRTVGVGH
jgi:CHAT domain-containing protein/lipopolysaccharide biosynthesis regulator YciM